MQRMRNTAVLLILVVLAAGGLRSTAFADEPTPPPPAPPAPALEFAPSHAFAPKPSMTPALIATGVSAMIVAAAVGSYVKFHQAATVRNRGGGAIIDNHFIERRDREVAEQVKWKNRTIGLVIATAVSGGFTGYMWSRRDGYRRVSVTPTGTGAEVSFSRSF